jgi:hypothetical protein
MIGRERSVRSVLDQGNEVFADKGPGHVIEDTDESRSGDRDYRRPKGSQNRARRWLPQEQPGHHDQREVHEIVGSEAGRGVGDRRVTGETVKRVAEIRH